MKGCARLVGVPLDVRDAIKDNDWVIRHLVPTPDYRREISTCEESEVSEIGKSVPKQAPRPDINPRFRNYIGFDVIVHSQLFRKK